MNIGQNTHMYGKKLLYNVDANPIVPQITIKRLVDHAIFFVANSGLTCEPEKRELIDEYPLSSTSVTSGTVAARRPPCSGDALVGSS